MSRRLTTKSIGKAPLMSSPEPVDDELEALKKQRQYQTITLVLTDGRRAYFTGPVQLTEDSGHVKAILVGEPTDLPADCSFNVIDAPATPKKGG